jgi:UDP-N-acetylglucosamine acyltransferase
MIPIHFAALGDQKSCIDFSVRVESRTIIGPHVNTGADNKVIRFNSTGAIPQDKKYADKSCRMEMVERNTSGLLWPASCEIHAGIARNALKVS